MPILYTSNNALQRLGRVCRYIVRSILLRVIACVVKRMGGGEEEEE